MKQFAYLRIWYYTEDFNEEGLFYTNKEYVNILKPYVKLSKISDDYDTFTGCYRMKTNLNALGELGWEIISVFYDENNNIEILYLKKEIIVTDDCKG